MPGTGGHDWEERRKGVTGEVEITSFPESMYKEYYERELLTIEMTSPWEGVRLSIWTNGLPGECSDQESEDWAGQSNLAREIPASPRTLFPPLVTCRCHLYQLNIAFFLRGCL